MHAVRVTEATLARARVFERVPEEVDSNSLMWSFKVIGEGVWSKGERRSSSL
jgi:hypothetical protein